MNGGERGAFLKFGSGGERQQMVFCLDFENFFRGGETRQTVADWVGSFPFHGHVHLSMYPCIIPPLSVFRMSSDSDAFVDDVGTEVPSSGADEPGEPAVKKPGKNPRDSSQTGKTVTAQRRIAQYPGYFFCKGSKCGVLHANVWLVLNKPPWQNIT